MEFYGYKGLEIRQIMNEYNEATTSPFHTARTIFLTPP